jgi:hypothetical protein
MLSTTTAPVGPDVNLSYQYLIPCGILAIISFGLCAARIITRCRPVFDLRLSDYLIVGAEVRTRRLVVLLLQNANTLLDLFILRLCHDHRRYGLWLGPPELLCPRRQRGKIASSRIRNTNSLDARNYAGPPFDHLLTASA